MNWVEKPILVTGATGFIGGRVCECLVLRGARRVRALVHTVQHAARIGRLPLDLCRGNLLDPLSLRRALADMKMVVHCGLGQGRGIARGTRNLLEAAEAAGVERFVHMSTAAVYGFKPSPGCETEESPMRRTGSPYCDNKMRAERIASRFSRRLPVVVLRPSIVYGPYAVWSTRLIHGLREGKVVLIDQGRGACNTTYVDNLVDAIFLALENPRAVGESFFITDGEQVTWGDFIGAHADMLEPRPALSEISSDQISAYLQRQPGLWSASFKAARRILFSLELRQMLMQIPIFERVLARAWSSMQVIDEDRKQRLRARLRGTGGQPDNGMFIPDAVTQASQSHAVFFRIDKARRILAYEPRIPFSRGIQLVKQWLRFANYL